MLNSRRETQREIPQIQAMKPHRIKAMIKYYNTEQNSEENMKQHNDPGTMNFGSKD